MDISKQEIKEKFRAGAKQKDQCQQDAEANRYVKTKSGPPKGHKCGLLQR